MEQREIVSEASFAQKERRRSPRFACSGFAEVLVLHPETLVRGEVRNISLTGCFVSTLAHLKVERGAKVELRFALNGNRLHIFAQVMDVRPGKGMGVEFLPGDASVEALLKWQVETLSGAQIEKQ